ncbi:hypothetical protein AB0K51_16590 [Kitasatospora sp. NPDC049285]|uniref:hypothetical protein n=1 Tax=Kitasatospora sp. NPDC049285 TaxID=3157096 RepID=UPI0034216166
MTAPSVLPGLVDLAATGAFGELRMDASLPELVRLLGRPWDGGRASKQHRWPHYFGWGDAETEFCRCRRLRSLCLQVWRSELELPLPGGGVRPVDGRVTESALTAALTAAGCRWETVVHGSLTDQRTLRVARGTSRVDFVLVDREAYDEPVLDDWLLAKAGLWEHREPFHACGEAPSPDDGWGA